MAISWIKKTFSLCFTVATCAFARAEDAQTIALAFETTEVKAFTLLKTDNKGYPVSGQIAGCGVKASAQQSGEQSEIRLTLFKDASRKGGTVFWITGTWTGLQGKTENITSFSIKTESMASPYAPSGVKSWNDGEGLRTGIPLELSDFDGANMMRELMLSGAQISIESDTHRIAIIRIPGPLPASDRAAYLNCAGDLFRPEQTK